VNKVSVHRACSLNALWHSRFPRIHWSNVVRNKDYICYVAEYGETLEDTVAYAVAIWSSPVAANRLNGGEAMLELRRMAISDDAPKNTASRMLSIMRKDIAKRLPHIDRLISYQDTEAHHGTIYKASGWTPKAASDGAAWTTKTRNRNKEQSRARKIRWEYELRLSE